jgi:hypothetical protein
MPGCRPQRPTARQTTIPCGSRRVSSSFLINWCACLGHVCGGACHANVFPDPITLNWYRSSILARCDERWRQASVGLATDVAHAVEKIPPDRTFTTSPTATRPSRTTPGVPWQHTVQEQHRQDDDGPHPCPPCSHGHHVSFWAHSPMFPGMIPIISLVSPCFHRQLSLSISGRCVGTVCRRLNLSSLFPADGEPG